MDDYGMKMAKGEVDVDTAGLKDLILHSGHPLLKIAEIGEGTITYTNDAAGVDDLVITHSLGYEPRFVVMTQWYDINAGVKRTTFRKGPFMDTLSNGAIYFDARPYVTTSALRYAISSFDGNGGTFDIDFIYILYYDPDDNP